MGVYFVAGLLGALLLLTLVAAGLLRVVKWFVARGCGGCRSQCARA